MKSCVHFVVAAMIIGGCLAGCRSAPKSVPVEAGMSDKGGNENYIARLTPGFVLRVTVTVAGTPEFEDLTKRVSESGQIALPLVGKVQVSGLTLEELSQQLTEMYSEYLVYPQVGIEFAKDENSEQVSPWGYVTVLGRVKNPGRVSIPPTRDLTVSGSIQLAGGLDTSARDSAVRLTRHGVDGKAIKFQVNLRKVGSRGVVEDDLLLLPGDVVYVPEMMF